MNRKQRRAIASKKGQKKMGVTVEKTNDKSADAANAAEEVTIHEVTLEDPAEQAERLQKMLSGRIVPPSDFVAYLIGQLRKVFQEQDQVNKQLQNFQAGVRQAENRARELHGMRQKYVEDIQAWDKKARDEKKQPADKAETEVAA